MCGIVAFVDVSRTAGEPELKRRIVAMRDACAHRGPDDSGLWIEGELGLAFGHCRLSIVDLSPAGAQPMTSPSGRFVITYNGEIYNFWELRNELSRAGISFQSGSDTEVLLAALDTYGFEETCRRCAGMWAFVAFDRATNSLLLSRDRLGKKPLYYGVIGGCFVAASELKSVQALGLELRLEVAAVHALMQYFYIPDPLSIYSGIQKLLPGHNVTIPLPLSAEVSTSLVAARQRKYWDFAAVAATRRGSPRDAEQEIREALTVAVKERMIADVPLGSFLSGGIDSSLVTAVMQTNSTEPVHTFSIGFENSAFDEADHARAVSKHLGTRHEELTVTHQDAMAVIPDLQTIYCEPFADSSQIPTYLLCKLARRHVTVALSGDGGDEVFGGYAMYDRAAQRWRDITRVPLLARRGLSVLEQIISPAIAALEDRFRYGGRIAGALRQYSAVDFDTFYTTLNNHWHPADPTAGVLTASTKCFSGLDLGGPVAHAMAIDARRYLVGDILVKVDRASMANSLEVRSPLLDHRLIEAAWRLPLDRKWAPGRGKIILREILGEYLPKPLFERPKKGFSIPLGDWLRGPLRPWASDLIHQSWGALDDLLDRSRIKRVWQSHLERSDDWYLGKLWGPLMLISWYDRNWR
ncbi:MAG: asparagine synthase (glutamine-hydrolyzing) [Parvibaculaceae bacterium]